MLKSSLLYHQICEFISAKQCLSAAVRVLLWRWENTHERSPATYHRQRGLGRRAAVWTATSADIDGLATEAATLEDLRGKVLAMIEELAELSAHRPLCV